MPGAVTGNPAEYCRRRECSQATNSWVPPAASVRIRALQPGGSWAMARRAVSMWSAAVFAPAFPGRSLMASASPVPAGP
jgi:hypothetical protein